MSKIMQVLMLTGWMAILLFLPSSNAHEITVTNRCGQTLWIGTHGDNQIPEGGGFRLDNGQQRRFSVIDGWTSGRIWGKTGCDNSGKNCITGESPPGGRTTFQPVTLAEFGLDKYMGLDFYDISLVDGFNLPMTIVPSGVNYDHKCKQVNCHFNFNVCPSDFRHYYSGSIVACSSACSATREDQYCCPSPPYNEQSCSPSQYSKIFKEQCPDAYSYAFDDATSLWACRGQSPSSSGYEVVFCP